MKEKRRIITVIFMFIVFITVLISADLLNVPSDYYGLYKYSHYLKYRTPKIEEDEEIGFQVSKLIYKNRYYYHLSSLDKNTEALGSFIGSFEQNYPQSFDRNNDYIELAGFGEGKVYEVKGYPSSLLLIKKDSEGNSGLYVSLDDFVLRRGQELFCDLFQIPNKLKGFEIIGEEGTYTATEEESKLLIKVLDNMYSEKLREYELSHKGIGSVRLILENGLSFTISFYGEGYVYFKGSVATCQKIDSELLKEVADMFYERERKDVRESELESLRETEYLSRYLPSYLPETIPFHHVNKDNRYSDKQGISAMEVYFTKSQLDSEPYLVISPKVHTSFGGLKDFKNKFELSELSVEKIKEAAADEAGIPLYEFTIRDSYYSIGVISKNISAEELYKILSSVEP